MASMTAFGWPSYCEAKAKASQSQYRSGNASLPDDTEERRLDAQGGRQRFEVRPFWSVADQQHFGVRGLGAGADQQLGALFRRQSGGGDDAEPARAAALQSRQRPVVRRRRRTSLE